MHCTLQCRPAFIDEIEPYMPRSHSGLIPPTGHRSQIHSFPRDVGLPRFAVPRERLHDVTIPIPRRKIHRRIDPRRVRPQRRLDQTQTFHKVPPVNRTQQPQTRDAVAHRDLIRRQHLALAVDELFDRKPMFRKLLLKPRTREMQHRTVLGQTLAKLRNKRACERDIRLRHFCDHNDELRWIRLRLLIQTLHPRMREIALFPRSNEAARDALEIVD